MTGAVVEQDRSNSRDARPREIQALSMKLSIDVQQLSSVYGRSAVARSD
jgi:hypothetical protein